MFGKLEGKRPMLEAATKQRQWRRSSFFLNPSLFCDL
jgi:hypothetical protein